MSQQDLEQAIQGQRDLHESISRAFDNLKKLGAANITPGAFEARLHALEAKWVRFERLDHDLRKNFDALLLKNKYYGVLGSIIGQDAAISEVEKLHYLKASLKGEAEALVKNLSITAENYDRAWNSLTDFYENKRIFVKAYLSAFTSLQRMKADSTAELRKIYHGIANTVGSLASINQPIHRSEDLFVHMAVELLDSRSRKEWETTISGSSDSPTFKELKTFMEQYLHVLDALQPIKSDTKVSDHNSRSAKAHHTHKNGTGQSRFDALRRALCKGDHFVMTCSQYQKKTPDERKLAVKANNLCLNCLGKHRVADCTSKKSCTACGGRHHTTVHEACRTACPAATASIQASHPAQRWSKERKAVLLTTAQVRVADRYVEGGTKRVPLSTRDRKSPW